ncbi:MAG: TrmH family RNA methyltransferase [Sandaracinaceae bacterium]
MMMERDQRVYGLHACMAVWAHRPDAVRRIFLTDDAAPLFGDVMRALASSRRPYRVVDDEEMQRASGTRHHEGVCFITDPLPEGDTGQIMEDLAASDGPARMLFLDRVDNPHNLGAVLRSAAHFGVTAIAGHADEMPVPQGAVARVAEGGAEVVPTLRWNRPQKGFNALRDRGFACVATVVRGGKDLYAIDLPPRCIFLLGAERDGLGPSALRVADVAVRIPGVGGVESLNVASASAVLLAEHFRRHPA